jgi:hypothetical protein
MKKREPVGLPSIPKPAERLLRRRDVATLLNRTPRSVDDLCDQGLLRKVVWPGRKNATGIPESDVIRLLTPPPLTKAQKEAGCASK